MIGNGGRPGEFSRWRPGQSGNPCAGRGMPLAPNSSPTSQRVWEERGKAAILQTAHEAPVMPPQTRASALDSIR
jgi:hypothetical protein